MTKNEAAVIVKMISTMYPNEYAKLSPESMKLIVEMWASTCEGHTGEQVSAALRQFVASDTSGFAPKPGQLINLIVAHEDGNDLTESEAWSMVLRAASNAIYHAEEEWAKLPPIVQKAVGTSHILREMAMEPVENNTVNESHFRRVYRTELERERAMRRMPPSSFKALGYQEAPALPGEE